MEMKNLIGARLCLLNAKTLETVHDGRWSNWTDMFPHPHLLKNSEAERSTKSQSMLLRLKSRQTLTKLKIVFLVCAQSKGTVELIFLGWIVVKLFRRRRRRTKRVKLCLWNDDDQICLPNYRADMFCNPILFKSPKADWSTKARY